MSGIAALLLELRHEVSGSDRVSTVETERLQRLGLRFHQQHRAEDARDAELVVFSSAIKINNPILVSARDSEKPVARRAEALAAIMHDKRAVLIAGMHGKTTTSAMAAHVLREAGVHPSHYVGAEIPILGNNAHWDPRGEYFVAEGDESDGTLRCFHPERTLILNIEEEHLDFYAESLRNSSIKPVEQSSITLMIPTLRHYVQRAATPFPTDFLRRPIIAASMSNCGTLLLSFAFIDAAKNSVK